MSSGFYLLGGRGGGGAFPQKLELSLQIFSLRKDGFTYKQGVFLHKGGVFLQTSGVSSSKRACTQKILACFARIGHLSH